MPIFPDILQFQFMRRRSRPSSESASLRLTASGAYSFTSPAAPEKPMRDHPRRRCTAAHHHHAFEQNRPEGCGMHGASHRPLVPVADQPRSNETNETRHHPPGRVAGCSYCEDDSGLSTRSGGSSSSVIRDSEDEDFVTTKRSRQVMESDLGGLGPGRPHPSRSPPDIQASAALSSANCPSNSPTFSSFFTYFSRVTIPSLPQLLSLGSDRRHHHHQQQQHQQQQPAAPLQQQQQQGHCSQLCCPKTAPDISLDEDIAVATSSEEELDFTHLPLTVQTEPISFGSTISRGSQPCSFATANTSCQDFEAVGSRAEFHIYDLDDDCLQRIMHFVLSPVSVTGADRVVERSYLGALPVASVSRRFRRVFHQSLIDLELWQSAKIPSESLVRVAETAGANLRRIVLRNCSQLSPASLTAVAEHCSSLRTIDISNVEAVDDGVLCSIVEKLGKTLTSLLARNCTKLTDEGLAALGRHGHALDALDISSLPLVTDHGMRALLGNRGMNIRSLVCSACPLLTDDTFQSIGANCKNLEVICSRSLPLITNIGVEALCSGVGDCLEVFDILDCDGVMVHGFADSVKTHCPRLSSRFLDWEGRTLRQVIISSLPGFIYHVTGRDAYNGRSAVYFLLVDPGTRNSFRVLVGTEHMNLVDFGEILCSCFGDRPSESVKELLYNEYGLDLDD